MDLLQVLVRAGAVDRAQVELALSQEATRLESELQEVLAAKGVLQGDGPSPAVAAPEKPVQRRQKTQPSGPRVKPTQVRDYVVEHREFTPAEMARDFNRSRQWSYTVMKPLLEKGVIRKTGRRGHDRAPIYEYIVPSSAGVPPARAGGESRPSSSAPVPGTGKARAGDKDIRPLLNQARKQGFQVLSHGKGHIMVLNPRTGARCIVSQSPSDRNAYKQVERDLEGIGMRL